MRISLWFSRISFWPLRRKEIKLIMYNIFQSYLTTRFNYFCEILNHRCLAEFWICVFLNIPAFWIMPGLWICQSFWLCFLFWIYQCSEYPSVSKYSSILNNARVINMPEVLDMSLVLNIPVFWICQDTQGSECVNISWMCFEIFLNMPEFT